MRLGANLAFLLASAFFAGVLSVRRLPGQPFPDGFVPKEKKIHDPLHNLEDRPRPHAKAPLNLGLDWNVKGGFLPRDKKPKALRSSDDPDWPPIQEPWRCLEHGKKSLMEFNSAIGIEADDPDCPLVTPEICDAADYYAVPCKHNTHAQCIYAVLSI